jgi:hypothetical protein
MNKIEEITKSIVAIIIVLGFFGSLFISPAHLTVTGSMLGVVLGYYFRGIEANTRAMYRLAARKVEQLKASIK